MSVGAGSTFGFYGTGCWSKAVDAPVEEQGWLYECLGQKPTLASVFSFGWGQTLALLVTCQKIT